MGGALQAHPGRSERGAGFQVSLGLNAAPRTREELRGEPQLPPSREEGGAESAAMWLGATSPSPLASTSYSLVGWYADL